MHILIANKFYYPRGGDCIYTINLENLLKQHSHNVAVFTMLHPENIRTPWDKYFPSEVKFSPGLGMIEATLRPFGTREVKRKFNTLLDDFQPDIVHLNNIHSQISPVIAEIAYERNIKVVWTLHDYKLLCPRYDCLRHDKEICEICFEDKKQVLKNKCMKNSLFASLIACKEAQKWTKAKLEKYTNIFICPSQFMANKMEQGGFDKSKLITLCNFIDTGKTKKDDDNKENYYCYIGRLSHEKGIKTLLEVASQLPYQLKVIGGGPLFNELQMVYSSRNIEFLGYKPWKELKEIVGHARFTVVPSEWYENNPLSVMESLCLGTPVLGANIGGIPELIEEEENGLLFESKNENDLTSKIEKMFTMKFDYQTIAENAQKRYSSENYYSELMKIYKG
jgi:glycosyltransferase involved in cell wall biosynthesis